MKPQVALAVLQHNGCWLLQLRDDIETIIFPGHWGLFGGHVESGETPVQALMRELKEEINWTPATVPDLWFSHDGGSRLAHVFRLELTTSPDQLHLLEGQELKLTSIEEISSGEVLSERHQSNGPLHRDCRLLFSDCATNKMDDQIWFDAHRVQTWLGGRRIVDDLSLQLKLGESTAILGPNGAGKSTLVKLIDRNLYPVVRPQSHLKLFGSSTINLWQLRQRLGVVSTELETRFSPQMSASEVVLSGFFGSMRLNRDQKPTNRQLDRVSALLHRLGLNSIRDEPFGKLSDGQRRRLMIARALVHEPDVLVLDEPNRALDLKASHQLLEMLRDLCRSGTTLVVVTHRIDTILPEMKRVLFLQNGGVLRDGTPSDLLKDQPLSDLFKTPLRVLEHRGFRQVLPG